ncbi:MAG: DUF2070 family protein [Candidatus Methylarchaceae archaeon HK01M]|nr:DUF2070 family protein [Candidatus Methylarchaceae archaeon HK01M]
MPSIKTAVLLAIIISATLFITSHIVLYRINSSTFITFLAFEAVLFASIIIEQMVLKGNPLVTFRRLVVLSSISNLIWLSIVFFGLILSIPFSIHLEKYISLLLLGLFCVIAFRMLVSASIFYGRLSKRVFSAFFQPLLLVPMLFPFPSTIEMAAVYTIPALGGAGIISSVALYLIVIDRSGARLIGVGSLNLFRSFLSAWAADHPEFIEEFMEKMSSQQTVRASVMIFDSAVMKLALVIPEVHPGPFHSVGSSNLPLYIRNWFLKKGFSPLILHGISGHELNLPSKREVDRFIATFEGLKTVASGQTCSNPVTTKVGKAISTCIAFGDVVFVMPTLSPFGMEDLPLDLKQKVEGLALKFGYSYTIIADTHNSQGEHIRKEDYDDLIEAIEKALSNLKSRGQHDLMVGAAHSSEFDLQLGEDIGPAGLGLLILDIDGEKYSIVVSDSNNAAKGLREELLERFKDSKAPLLELCTSDTHVTAGKISNLKGYITLGERTGLNELSEAIKTLMDKAVERIARAKFQVKWVDSLVKVIGLKLIDNLSIVLEKSFSLVKKGGLAIITFSFVVLLLTAIFI